MEQVREYDGERYIVGHCLFPVGMVYVWDQERDCMVGDYTYDEDAAIAIARRRNEAQKRKGFRQKKVARRLSQQVMALEV
jgi:hypothetical protein